MINLRTIARPYAKAVLDLAIEQNSFTQWSRWLHFLSLVICDKDVATIINNLAVASQSKAKLLCEVGKDILSVEAENLVNLLAYEKRLQIIPEIYSVYEDLRRAEQKQVVLNVNVALPLEGDEQEMFNSMVAKQIKESAEIDYLVDEKLLAGGVLKIGDRIIDASLRGKLMLLRQQLIE